MIDALLAVEELPEEYRNQVQVHFPSIFLPLNLCFNIKMLFRLVIYYNQLYLKLIRLHFIFSLASVFYV